MEVRNTENKRYIFHLTDEVDSMIDDHLDKSRFRYRSEFVAEAVRRYCCDLDSTTHRNVIAEETERIMDAKIDNLGNRMAHINFKIAVELAVLSLLLSDKYFKISDEEMRGLRGAALDLVRKSSGFVRFEDALEDSRRHLKIVDKK